VKKEDGLQILSVRRESSVEHVTLNRPDARNAFNAEMIAELSSWATSFPRASDGVRAVVIGGAGKAFCAGADAAWLAQIARHSEDDNIATRRPPRRCSARSTNCRSL